MLITSNRLCIILMIVITNNTYSQIKDIMVDVTAYTDLFNFDIRYATSSNFLEEKVYDCSKCYLLPEVALQIVYAGYFFCDLGYTLVFYDCYRPLAVQKKMWAIKPNAIYLANPSRGSIHNRGAAIDVTLVKLDGSYVDMGTDYDFFGRAAHTDNNNLPAEVLENRKLLQDGMLQFGFSIIQSEWWHFNYLPKSRSPILDISFDCD